MKQLNIFETLPKNVLENEWMKEHIKCPPPVNITYDQKEKARIKLNDMYNFKLVHNSL